MSEILKQLMTERKIKQRQIANALGIQQSQVSMILHGKRELTEEQVRTLAQFFEVKMDVFISEAMMNGQAVTSISIGTADSVGENSPGNPILIKEKLKPKMVKENYSEVSLSFGLTKSLGNFEFMRVDVFAKDFCASDKKQECWDLLDKEILERLEKVLANVEKYRSTPVGLLTVNSVPLPPLEDEKNEVAIPLPPLENEVKVKTDDLLELKKLIYKEVKRLAIAGKFKFNFAVQKLSEVQFTKEFAQDLLSSLERDDVKFFTGEANGASESQSCGSEDSREGGEGES